MTSFDFSRLPMPTRFELIQSRGEFIGTRQSASHKISLYAIHGFYVEMYVLTISNQLHRIEIQEDDNILTEYTKDLRLDDLFDY